MTTSTAVYVTAPPHVASCDLGPATLLLSYRTSEVYLLRGQAATWWKQLAASSDPDRCTALDSETSHLVAEQLLHLEFLAVTEQPAPWPAPIPGKPITASWGTLEGFAGLDDRTRVPLAGKVVATAALLLTITLRRGRAKHRIPRLLRVMAFAATLTRRPATTAETASAVDAVRTVAALLPARVACLEESVAATLALAVTGKGVTWCHGVAGDPVRLHAWLETHNGEMVAEPTSTRQCTTLRAITT